MLILSVFPSLPSHALIIAPTYDISVTTNVNAAQILSAFNTAVQYFQNLYTNNITINITVYFGPYGPFTSGVGLGASETSFSPSSYISITNALRNSRTTAADSNAVASLPTSDPMPGQQWYVPRANVKALKITGLGVAANDSTLDGSIAFANTVSYTFDPTNRAVAGKYDFIGVAQHEITEVMGRVFFDLATVFIPYDLFRFTSSGVRSFNINATGTYFSVDNGVTNLRNFWTNPNVGDVQDWLPSGAADSYDYSLSPGKKTVLSYADLIALDVIGYNLNYAAPREIANKSGTNFILSFTNTPGTTYTLLATTNLSLAISNWPTLGIVTDSVPGQFQFTDTQAATNRQRFFRVRLN